MRGISRLHQRNGDDEIRRRSWASFRGIRHLHAHGRNRRALADLQRYRLRDQDVAFITALSNGADACTRAAAD